MVKTVHWEIYIVLMFLVFGCFAYFDDRPTHRDIRSEVLAEPFADGDAMIYRWSGYVTRNCQGHLRRELRQGGEVYHLNARPFPWIPTDQWKPDALVEHIVSVPLRDLMSTLEDGQVSYHVTEVAICNQIQALFGKPVESEYPVVAFNINKSDPRHYPHITGE